jgi:cell wall-associated NlpC family hydrolase
MTLGSPGRYYARLGAWLPRVDDARLVMAATVLVAGLLVALAPSAALAQETQSDNETSGGTVRVRSVDNAETVAESEDDGAFASVATRDMPETESAVPAIGDSIVAFALQYVGYPYVWAGNTPAGFDCSGFTQFVILNTIGIDIGHGLGGQPGAGAWVDAGALLPGDLVFFQNTYQPGLSHAGIYIGDGLFVHAENEGTGVVVTALWSDYYGSRFWGAVRVA